MPALTPEQRHDLGKRAERRVYDLGAVLIPVYSAPWNADRAAVKRAFDALYETVRELVRAVEWP